MKVLMLTAVFALFTTACAHKKSCCADKCARPVKHDIEHHHVAGPGDHEHDEDHHKVHDHKAHHPQHDATTHGHDKEHQHVDGTVDHAHDDAHHGEHDHKAHHPEHGKEKLKKKSKKQ